MGMNLDWKDCKWGDGRPLTAIYKGELLLWPFEDDYWVDMGLPSGTLWAKYDLGATQEKEVGTPVPIMKMADGTVAKDPNCGINANVTFGPEYDQIAQYRNYEEGAHVAKSGEWKELIDRNNCTWTAEGNWWKVTSKTNGNVIYIYNTNSSSANPTYQYWTSTFKRTYSNRDYYDSAKFYLNQSGKDAMSVTNVQISTSSNYASTAVTKLIRGCKGLNNAASITMQNELTLALYTDATIVATYLPAYSTVKWYTLDPSIATVNQGGGTGETSTTSKATVTGESVGSTTLYCSNEDGTVFATCEISVVGASANPSCTDHNKFFGFVGTEFIKIELNVTDESGYTWSSDNPSIASVVDGVITINSLGKTIIRCVSGDGSESFTWEVTGIPVPTDLTQGAVIGIGGTKKRLTVTLAGEDLNGNAPNRYPYGTDASTIWPGYRTMTADDYTYITSNDNIHHHNGIYNGVMYTILGSDTGITYWRGNDYTLTEIPGKSASYFKAWRPSSHNNAGQYITTVNDSLKSGSYVLIGVTDV